MFRFNRADPNQRGTEYVQGVKSNPKRGLMSSIIFSRMLTPSRAEDIKVPAVSNQGPSLAEYVKRTRERKRLSLTDVERQSRGGISESYVSRIENGYILNVTPKKLRALARGLGITEAEIFLVESGKSLAEPEGRQALLLALFRQLPPSQQDHAIDMLHLLCARYAKKNEQPAVVSNVKSITGKKRKRLAA